MQIVLRTEMKQMRVVLALAAFLTLAVGASAQRDLFKKGDAELRRQEMVLSMQAAKTRGQISNLKVATAPGRGNEGTQVFKNKSGDVVYVKERLYNGKDLVGLREYFFEDERMYHVAEDSSERVSVFGKRERKVVALKQRFFLDTSGRVFASYRTSDGRTSGMSGGETGSYIRRGYDLAGIKR